MQKNYFEAAAAMKARKIINDINNCFFITQHSGKSRPMSTCKFDDDGTIWFFTDIRSEKVSDINNDTEVRLLYADPKKNTYLDIQGEAEIVTDRARMKQFWTAIVKVWFPDGVEDPNLCLLRILPFSAMYWEAESAKMIQAIRIAASVITGENLVEGSEGTLSI